MASGGGRDRGFKRSVAFLALVAVTACSSSAHTSPEVASSSTTPTGRGRTVVAQYLSASGAPLLAFERSTQALMTGRRPQRADCKRLMRDVVPKVLPTSASQLTSLLARVPDAELRDALTKDVHQRLFMLTACVSGSGLNDSEDEQRVFQAFLNTSLRVESLLQRENIRM